MPSGGTSLSRRITLQAALSGIPSHGGGTWSSGDVCPPSLHTAKEEAEEGNTVHRQDILPRTDEVRRFLGSHPETVMKSLPKKDPSANPIELPVNRRMSSFVQSNRCYYNRDELRGAGSAFLSSYNAVYAAG